MLNSEYTRTDFKPIIEPSGIEPFLSQIARPSPFIAIALILPNAQNDELPVITQWVYKLMQDSLRASYWDQAETLAPSFYPKTQITLKYPIPVRLRTGITPINVLPYQPDFASLSEKREADKIDCLKHLIRSLKNSSEVWVSIKASEVKKYFSIIQASDALCVITPPGKNAVLSGYEAIKAIRLSGCYQPVGLLDFASQSCPESDYSGYQIKNAAKKFLAIDLAASGVVLSNSTYIPPENKANLRMRISLIKKSSQDFLYRLCEASLYKMPGLI